MALIDYLAITGGPELLAWLEVNADFGDAVHSRGMYNYAEKVELPRSAGAMLLHGGNGGGFHLRLSGKACEHFREHLPYLLTLGRASRIDVAEDVSGITVPQVREYIDSGRVRSLGQKVVCMTSTHGESPMTLYCGSRTSDKFLRVYWKEERVRFEFECKGDLAKAVQAKILAGTPLHKIMGGLGSFLDHKGANSHRDKMAEFWLRLVAGTCDKIKVLAKKVTESSQLTWLYKSCAKSLAWFSEADPEFVDRLIKAGRLKLMKARIDSMHRTYALLNSPLLTAPV